MSKIIDDETVVREPNPVIEEHVEPELDYPSTESTPRLRFQVIRIGFHFSAPTTKTIRELKDS